MSIKNLILARHPSQFQSSAVNELKPTVIMFRNKRNAKIWVAYTALYNE